MIEFSDGQKKTVAAGLTMLSLALVFAFVAVAAWGLLKALAFIAPAIVPVILGFFLALFFKPYYGWFVRRLHNPTLALLVMLATVLVPVGLILWHAGAVLVDQASNLMAQGPGLVRQVLAWFQSTFPKLHGLMSQMGVPYETLGEFYTKYGATALKAGSGVLWCLTGAVSILVTLIFFVFFLMTKERRGSEIVDQLTFLKASTQGFLAEQIDAFVDILVSFFQRQIVICILEGVMYGAGFWLVGLPYGFLIGFALGILNLIPLFGSLVCLPVALPLAYFAQGGSVSRLVMVLAVWGCGQILDGYFITPRIQGDKTGLGYAGVIFSFFFWSTVLGPLLGMLLAIPLSAFCVALWRTIKARMMSAIRLERETQVALWGEAEWLVSVRPEALSRVQGRGGRTFRDICPNYPLLIKKVRADKRLSVQVHPDAESAKTVGGESKVEMWCVLKSGPLYIGFKPGVTMVDVERAVKDGSFEELLVKFDAKVGECYLIPGGLVHALGEGTTVYEVQQSSDTTFRLYDWGRVDADGRPRKLHVKEALETINLGLPSPKPTSSINCEYFAFDKVAAGTLPPSKAWRAVYVPSTDDFFMLAPDAVASVSAEALVSSVEVR